MRHVIRCIAVSALIYLVTIDGLSAWSWGGRLHFPVGDSELIAPVDCELFATEPQEQHACAYFFSAMNHADAQRSNLGAIGRRQAMVQLPLVLISATPGKVATTAVLVPGGGGPGNSLGMGRPGYRFADLSAGVDVFLRAGMDVLLVDQRGTGLSLPQMNCPELGQSYQDLLSSTLDAKRINAAVENALMGCQQRVLSQGFDISTLDSRDSAKDFLALMQELPYQHWVVAGVSYGALLAYEMAAQEPDRIDALILDSLPGLEQEGRYLSSADMHQRIQAIFAHCHEQRECAKTYANIDEQLHQLLQRLAHKPVMLNLDGQGEMLLDDERLLRVLFNAAYWPEYIAYIPYVIRAAAESNDFEPVSWMAHEYYAWMTDTQYGDILHTNIFCEVTLPLQQERLSRFPELQQAWNPSDHLAWQSSVKLCQSWGVTPDYSRNVFPAVINTPSLILSGGLDPITPSADAVGMQHWMMNSRVVVDAESAHGLLFGTNCTQQQVWRFLEELNLSGQTQQRCYSQPIQFN